MVHVKFSRRLTLPPFEQSVCLSDWTLSMEARNGESSGNKVREGFADAINRAAFGNQRVFLRRCGRVSTGILPTTPPFSTSC